MKKLLLGTRICLIPSVNAGDKGFEEVLKQHAKDFARRNTERREILEGKKAEAVKPALQQEKK